MSNATANEYCITLNPPAFLNLVSSCGNFKARIDLYEAWRFVVEANKQPTPDKRWEVTKAWIADKLRHVENHDAKITSDQISESMAVLVTDAIQKAGSQEEDQLKNELSRMLSSHSATNRSQQDGNISTNEPNKPSSTTSPTVSP